MFVHQFYLWSGWQDDRLSNQGSFPSYGDVFLNSNRFVLKRRPWKRYHNKKTKSLHILGFPDKGPYYTVLVLQNDRQRNCHRIFNNWGSPDRRPLYSKFTVISWSPFQIPVGSFGKERWTRERKKTWSFPMERPLLIKRWKYRMTQRKMRNLYSLFTT